MATILEASEAYGEQQGFFVFPVHYASKSGDCSCDDKFCKAKGKHPTRSNWQARASRDVETIRELWRHKPGANIGIKTGKESGIFVLDIDPKNSGDTSLDQLLVEFGDLPTTVRSNTGSGGTHFIFKLPPGGMKNRTNIRPGIDVRGEGGYIVAPPSSHASGRRYEWHDGCAPDECDIADAPEWLIALCTEPVVAADALDGDLPEGSRNDSLYRAAVNFFRAGVPNDVAKAAISQINLKRCKPPLKANEVKSLVQSASNVDAKSYPFTQGGNASRFLDTFADDLRFSPSHGWFAWNGKRWVNQDAGAQEKSKQLIVHMRRDLKMIDAAIEAASAFLEDEGDENE